MRIVHSATTTLAALALAVLAGPTASHAATPRAQGMVVSVRGETSYEYVKSCSNTAPYPCGTYNAQLTFTIYTTNQGSAAVTVGYQTVNGTATAGSDYVATSGTVTIQQNSPQAYVRVTLINDGVGEPTETFSLKLTSTSSPGDISSVGTGTVLDGGQVPADCNLSKTAPNQESMTCTGRPAGQQWYLDQLCRYPLGDPELVGNVVTGNGTSSGTCNVGTTSGEANFFTI